MLHFWMYLKCKLYLRLLNLRHLSDLSLYSYQKEDFIVCLSNFKAYELCDTYINLYTVKPVLKATCIKQSPVLKGQFFISLLRKSSVD